MINIFTGLHIVKFYIINIVYSIFKHQLFQIFLNNLYFFANKFWTSIKGIKNRWLIKNKYTNTSYTQSKVWYHLFINKKNSNIVKEVCNKFNKDKNRKLYYFVFFYKS